jgi:hypothetical protein
MSNNRSQLSRHHFILSWISSPRLCISCQSLNYMNYRTRSMQGAAAGKAFEHIILMGLIAYLGIE